MDFSLLGRSRNAAVPGVLQVLATPPGAKKTSETSCRVSPRAASARHAGSAAWRGRRNFTRYTGEIGKGLVTRCGGSNPTSTSFRSRTARRLAIGSRRRETGGNRARSRCFLQSRRLLVPVPRGWSRTPHAAQLRAAPQAGGEQGMTDELRSVGEHHRQVWSGHVCLQPDHRSAGLRGRAKLQLR